MGTLKRSVVEVVGEQLLMKASMEETKQSLEKVDGLERTLEQTIEGFSAQAKNITKIESGQQQAIRSIRDSQVYMHACPLQASTCMHAL